MSLALVCFPYSCYPQGPWLPEGKSLKVKRIVATKLGNQLLEETNDKCEIKILSCHQYIYSMNIHNSSS